MVSNEHKITVVAMERYLDRYYSFCSCGWGSAVTYTSAGAATKGNLHKLEMYDLIKREKEITYGFGS